MEDTASPAATPAFVTPGSAAALRSAAARRAGAICRVAPRQPPPVMKKVRRGASTDDDSNAVDVFGGTRLSQEELLANALAEPASVAPRAKKSPKKNAAAANAVDVFAAPDLDPDALLAAAMADDDPEAPAKGKKGKAKTKAKKGRAVNEEDNAVDVFAGANVTPEELLRDAMGDLETVDAPKKKKKKAKRGAGTVEADNEVDVFAGSQKTQEELLAAALGEDVDTPESDNVTKKGKGKGKKKGKKGIVSGDENAVDVMGDAGLSQEELLASALGEEVPSPGRSKRGKKDGKDRAIAQDVVEDTVASAENGVSDDEEEEEDSAPTAEDRYEVDEDFEPDAEVVNEFETVSQEFAIFTAAGRREKSKSKRGERNAAEGRLADPRRANFGSGGEKFTSVRLEDVNVTFRNTTILNGVTWGVKTGERVGLIGENGCGKTTQLRIIAGLLEPTSGEVIKSSQRTKASFLRQEFIDELDPTRTLREEFFSAFAEESEILAQYAQCEKEIDDAGDNLTKLETLLNQLEELRQKGDQKDVWNLDSRVDKVMPGLGFSEEDNDKLVASFSGGWKVRIGLGKVLLQDPDLLLLDEPSNHLDNESVEWLEAYLQTCQLPMVVVSHDREFLDRVCTKIVDIEGGEAFEYPGNYSRFVRLKKEQRKAWETAYERQQKFVKEQQQYIKQNRRTAARSSQVKSREKMLIRMERTGQMVRQPPRQGKPLVFRFPPAPRSGRDCILVDEVTHGYDGRVLFKDASIAIERGDRIALIGPNGCGKSTLLRMITGREEPQQGNVQCDGLTNVTLAYYEQNQADALDLNVTVVETLKRAAPEDMRYEEIRALLGKFLFKGDAVDKKVGALSGGEKARLALAKIMLEPANVLVLDEPGNHLSISAKEMLEEALQHFDGTLLLVSHDRYLISQVATQILAVEEEELVLYDGDYKSYMEKNEALKERLQARFIPGVAEIKNAPKISEEQLDVFVGKKQTRKKNFGGSGINSGKTKEMNAKRWNK